MQMTSKLAVALLAGLAVAHPGEHHHHSRAEELSRREFKAAARRGLNGCQEELQKRDGVYDRAIQRRAAQVAKHRKRLAARDTDTILNTTHHSTANYTPDTDANVIFSSNSTCIPAPDGEVGPYWVKGEYLRTDLVDGQPGVPVTLEAQFLDVETCKPITDIYWDLWNCNATGIYSGVQADGNGNADDDSNLNATYLRGIAKTNCDGVVQFDTLFPGHYSGRTNHHHMIAHLNATVLPNNTLVGGSVPHITQLFWDQEIVNAVEATYPYNTNNVTLTTNAEDRVFGTETADGYSDPVFEYVYLGDDVSDGLFGWITIAVNTSASSDPAYSFALTSGGGIAETGGDSGTVIGGGAGLGNDTTSSAAASSTSA